ncbi:unnamed protein product, partial [Mesorhabditis spiculigera]
MPGYTLSNKYQLRENEKAMQVISVLVIYASIVNLSFGVLFVFNRMKFSLYWANIFGVMLSLINAQYGICIILLTALSNGRVWDDIKKLLRRRLRYIGSTLETGKISSRENEKKVTNTRGKANELGMGPIVWCAYFVEIVLYSGTLLLAPIIFYVMHNLPTFHPNLVRLFAVNLVFIYPFAISRFILALYESSLEFMWEWPATLTGILFERLFATIMAASYESVHYRWFFIFLTFLGVAFAGLMGCFFVLGVISPSFAGMLGVVGSTSAATATLAALRINRQKIRKIPMPGYTLTNKYQLRENEKAMQVCALDHAVKRNVESACLGRCEKDAQETLESELYLGASTEDYFSQLDSQWDPIPMPLLVFSFFRGWVFAMMPTNLVMILFERWYATVKAGSYETNYHEGLFALLAAGGLLFAFVMSLLVTYNVLVMAYGLVLAMLVTLAGGVVISLLVEMAAFFNLSFISFFALNRYEWLSWYWRNIFGMLTSLWSVIFALTMTFFAPISTKRLYKLTKSILLRDWRKLRPLPEPSCVDDLPQIEKKVMNSRGKEIYLGAKQEDYFHQLTAQWHLPPLRPQ